MNKLQVAIKALKAIGGPVVKTVEGAAHVPDETWEYCPVCSDDIWKCDQFSKCEGGIARAALAVIASGMENRLDFLISKKSE